MTLRRYAPLKPGRGSYVPAALRIEVLNADSALTNGRGCVGPAIGMPGECAGPLDPDHIRSSGALSRKSPTVRSNLATLCRFVHHRLKTENGKVWRPKLLDWVAKRDGLREVEGVAG